MNKLENVAPVAVDAVLKLSGLLQNCLAHFKPSDGFKKVQILSCSPTYTQQINTHDLEIYWYCLLLVSAI